MSSLGEQSEERSASATSSNNSQGKLAMAILLCLLSALLMFDLLSVYAPGWMGSEIYTGSVYTVGVAFAFVLMAAVAIAATYYVHCVNKLSASQADSLADSLADSPADSLAASQANSLTDSPEDSPAANPTDKQGQ